jgi:hypothetical protein
VGSVHARRPSLQYSVYLAFDTSETLYGNEVTVAAVDKIYTFSTSNGTETFVANTDGDQNTLALTHTCATPQPAPQVVVGPKFTG